MSKEKPNKRNLIGTFIIASIAYIVLGVFMVAKNDVVADGINVVFGIIMLIYGVINVISFFLNKDDEENLFLELAMGVIAVGLGIFALIWGEKTTEILFYAIGAVIVVDSVVNIKRAFNLKTMGFTRWNYFLIAALIGLLLGILCILFYNFWAKAIVIFIGIALVYEGLSSLIIIFLDSRTRKKVTKELARYNNDRD